VIKAAQKNI